MQYIFYQMQQLTVDPSSPLEANCLTSSNQQLQARSSALTVRS